MRPSEIKAIAGGLNAVALVDGVHELERAFIADLADLIPVDPGLRTSLAQVEPLEPVALAALLATPESRILFLKAAYRLAWADGQVSFAERALIDAYASTLGVSADDLAQLEGEVKDHLGFADTL